MRKWLMVLSRLDGVRGFYASPLGAKGRVYLASQNGTTLVIKHGPEFEVLATNVLDESLQVFYRSPDGSGYRGFLCFAERPS